MNTNPKDDWSKVISLEIELLRTLFDTNHNNVFYTERKGFSDAFIEIQKVKSQRKSNSKPDR